jgi:hypothetical protein
MEACAESVAALGRAPHYSGSTRAAQRWKGQWRLSVPASPDISYVARNANHPERRLAVGFAVAITLKAD